MSAVTVGEVLLVAAERARQARTTKRAIQVAWSSCHTNPDLIGDVFAAWAHAEDVARVANLGDVLHRRYGRATPADIAQSLQEAARRSAA